MQPVKRDSIKNRLLAALPLEDLDRIYAHLHPVPLSLRQVLYDVGSPLDYVYFVQQGVTSVITTMANGMTVEACMIGPEGIVGVPALLGSKISSQHFVVQVPGTALRMNASTCKVAFDQSPAFRRGAFRCIEALLNVSAQSAACNRLHTVEQRAARWLLMARDRTQSDTMPMTHEFLSAMLGVRRAGVTKVAVELQRAALISYHRCELTILDHEGLEALACECYAIDHARFSHLIQ
jgi:CRP-like cAMP-binding protein